MSLKTDHDGWARLRFSIIGPLLAAPPESGDLHQSIENLSKKLWRHPVNGTDIKFDVEMIEKIIKKFFVKFFTNFRPLIKSFDGDTTKFDSFIDFCFPLLL